MGNLERKKDFLVRKDFSAIAFGREMEEEVPYPAFCDGGNNMLSSKE